MVGDDVVELLVSFLAPFCCWIKWDPLFAPCFSYCVLCFFHAAYHNWSKYLLKSYQLILHGLGTYDGLSVTKSAFCDDIRFIDDKLIKFRSGESSLTLTIFFVFLFFVCFWALFILLSFLQVDVVKNVYFFLVSFQLWCYQCYHVTVSVCVCFSWFFRKTLIIYELEKSWQC